MANLKDDASTDIESKVAKFSKEITSTLKKLRKARLDTLNKAKSKTKDTPVAKPEKPPSVPVVTFSLSTSKVSQSRTPAEQARLVSKGASKVCWSSHMADKARHVKMRVDGKLSWNAEKALGDDFEAFKKKWRALMKKNSLKNMSGKDGWPGWDQFHLELPDSKVPRSDDRAKSCLEEYARLTRNKGKKKNTKFEQKYSKLLKTYIDKYEKEANKSKNKNSIGL